MTKPGFVSCEQEVCFFVHGVNKSALVIRWCNVVIWPVVESNKIQSEMYTFVGTFTLLKDLYHAKSFFFRFNYVIMLNPHQKHTWRGVCFCLASGLWNWLWKCFVATNMLFSTRKRQTIRLRTGSELVRWRSLDCKSQRSTMEINGPVIQAQELNNCVKKGIAPLTDAFSSADHFITAQSEDTPCWPISTLCFPHSVALTKNRCALKLSAVFFWSAWEKQAMFSSVFFYFCHCNRL